MPAVASFAKEIVAEYTEEQLADVFYYYGELKQSRRIASAIVKARAKEGIETTGQLAEITSPLLGYDREKKDLARVFQALRIEVNGEMKVLKQMLDGQLQGTFYVNRIPQEADPTQLCTEILRYK